MKRIAPLVLACLVLGPALDACSVQQVASDEICQPSQLVRCNTCRKPDPNDPRVWRGWIQCSSDGKSFVGTCNDCAPDDSSSGAGGGSSGSGSGGPFGSSGDDGGSDPAMISVTGILDMPGQVQTMYSPDGTATISSFTASASSISYDQLPSQAPNLEQASYVQLMPPLGACNGSLSFTLSLTSASFTFGGSDLGPAHDCATYAATLAQGGITAVFQDVPYPDGSTAAQVTVTLEP